MNVNYNDNSRHIGHNNEKAVILNNGISQDEMYAMIACVRENSISKDDIDRLIEVLNNINASQNDLTTEFAKMVDEQKDAQKKGTLKKLQENVSLTNGMISLGKTAIGIATNNPIITVPAILEMAKEMTK